MIAMVVAARALPSHAIDLIRRIAVAPATHPMDTLRTVVSYLAHTDPDCQNNAPEAELRKSVRLTAQIATAIGLFAAIPAVVAYNRFSARSEMLISRYYTFADEFSSILHRRVHTSEGE